MSDSVVPEKKCQHCGSPSEADFCDPCFQEDLVDELCGGDDEPEPEFATCPVDIHSLDALLTFIHVKLTDDEVVEWHGKLDELICDAFGVSNFNSQADLLNTFDELFLLAVDLFVLSFDARETRWYRLPAPEPSSALQLAKHHSWKVTQLTQKLAGLVKVREQDISSRESDARSDAFHALHPEFLASLLRPRRVAPRPVDSMASVLANISASISARAVVEDPPLRPPAARVEFSEGDPAAPKEVRGLESFYLCPDWLRMPRSARRCHIVIYRRAVMLDRAAGLSCEVGVRLLMKATGYSRAQVKRGLAALRRGGWIDYIEVVTKKGRVLKLRGRPKIGCSRYWVVRHPDGRKKS